MRFVLSLKKKKKVVFSCSLYGDSELFLKQNTLSHFPQL